MFRSSRIVVIVVLIGSLLTVVAPAHAALQYGGGLHYLRTLGDIKDAPGIDEDSFGILASVAFQGLLVRGEFDLEYIADYIGSDEAMFIPQGYALLGIGPMLYAGVGIGVGHLGDFGWQDPFYAIRAGVNFGLGGLNLDAFTTYRFQKSDDFDALGSDDLNSLTFGAIVRFSR